MSIEIWKTMIDFPEYEISSLCRVREKESNKILKEVISGQYKQVFLRNKIRRYIHRLVAMNFIENPNSYSQVNHKDENKLNNNLENLEWCTAKYNSNYGNQSEKIRKAIKGKSSIKKSIAQLGNKKALGKGYTHSGWHHTEESKKKISETFKIKRELKKGGDV